MSPKKPLFEAMSYFMHDVDGRLYGAWFRRPSSTHVEVVAQGHIKSAPCGATSPERAAALLLEEIVRTSGPGLCRKV
jgi:hypothetical protein